MKKMKRKASRQNGVTVSPRGNGAMVYFGHDERVAKELCRAVALILRGTKKTPAVTLAAIQAIAKVYEIGPITITNCHFEAK